ncbi:MAG TPA: hypothetical protein VGZ22_19515, partial [Isosphaeraceae bacterium]|nr:hypothetical protein [Isosphaeraceae bacterium]
MRTSIVLVVIVTCLLALLAACYGSVLFTDRQFCYRDAGHFYYPLYQRVEQEWKAGRWPLWEPEENAGMPLLGNPTAAVLYPGKIIYAIFPLRLYAWGARLYVVAHTALAFLGMLVLLRSWQVSWVGSGLGALSFAFAGPILFQYCNVIFLVGAAWMPWGFRAVDRWLRLGRRFALIELAVVLAMQTLGGDPQAAYMTGICAGGYALGLAWASRGVRSRTSTRLVLADLMLVVAWVGLVLGIANLLYQEGPVRKHGTLAVWMATGRWSIVLWLVAGLVLLAKWRKRTQAYALISRMSGLAAAGVLALGLTAAQLVPVIEFTQLSLRAAEEGPHEIYPFSLEPHRLVEMVWPNFYGTAFRENRMWLSMVPPSHSPSTWVPSLYFGGIAFVLALGALSQRKGPPWRVWMTAVAVFSFLAALGEFGSPIWWARSLPAGVRLVGPHDPPPGQPFRSDGGVHDGDGSFYWLLATLLPGFRSFRYPSKLLTLTCLAVAALAGMGWDRLCAGTGRRIVIVTAALLAVSLGGLGAVMVLHAQIVAAFRAHPAARGGSIFGPINPAGAVSDLQYALGHGAVSLALTLALAFLVTRRPRFAGILALILLTADLAVANSGMVLTLPQTDFETQPRLLALIEQAEK